MDNNSIIVNTSATNVTVNAAEAPHNAVINITEQLDTETIGITGIPPANALNIAEQVDQVTIITSGSRGLDGRKVELGKTTTHIVWRYDGDTVWTNLVAITDLQGIQGFSVLNGFAAPTSDLGRDGDFYIDLSSNMFYGPKATGWGMPVSMVGPQGNPGPEGPAGPAVSVGMTFKGVWDSTVTYVKGDWVGYNGNSYVAVATTTNEQPNLSVNWYQLIINAPAGPIGPQGVQGPVGPLGPEGPAGIDGIPGPQGIQGIAGPQGSTGPTGPQGIQGIAGPAGPQGVQGDIGPKGDTGPMGPSILNYKGIWSSTTSYIVNDWVSYQIPGETIARAYFALAPNTNVIPGTNAAIWSLLSVSGPTGPAGPQGPSGTVGPAGPQGAAGPQGIQGIPGPAGADGPQGLQGIQGVAGPSGPSGGGAFSGRLNLACTSSSLTIAVQINDEWPRVPEDCSFYTILIDNELMTVTARSTIVSGVSTFTVTRAILNTAATAHKKGALVYLRMMIGAAGPQGIAGSTGPQGAKGDPGVGVPTGGLAGQVLGKVDSTDYSTQWVTFSGGTGGTGLVRHVQDLSNQIPATSDHYTVSFPIHETMLYVYKNGLRQEPATTIVDSNGLGFTTGFTCVAGDVLVADYNGDDIPPIELIATMTIAGLITTSNGSDSFTLYNTTSRTRTISKVFCAVKTPSSNGAVIVDIHKNGYTIFTNPANRPSIAQGALHGEANTIDSASWLPGEYLEMMVDTAGTGATFLVVHINYS